MPPLESAGRNVIDVAVEQLDVAAYTIPTDLPEADGTICWNSTTLVVVHVTAAGTTGMGYTYADTATAELIRSLLAGIVQGREAMAVAGAWTAMVHAIRNLGRPGIASMAVAAVDNALWDLKARLLDVPLVSLLGAVRDRIAIYGSGGFTSYTMPQLQRQLAGWIEQGIGRVKMKVGTRPEDDLARVRAARAAIGDNPQLFVDANGAYSQTQALAFAERFRGDSDVTWFEEPRPSDDLAGLRWLRDRAPAGMDIAAGEYGYDAGYFRRMLEAYAVDVLQADATRCGGVTGFLQAAALATAQRVPFSAHCAPSLHAHLCCAVGPARHVEYFHDHARIEHLLFEGALDPVDGCLQPDLTRPGLGLELRKADADRYAA